MKERNTKQEILNASLDLFSTKGYEATSTSQIAEAVGIRKSSLYCHFDGKQEILDSLIQNVLEQYQEHSIFVTTDWNDPNFTKDKENITVNEIIQMILHQVKFIINNSQISKARKMLVIEQFRNTQMAELQTKQNYTNVMNYFIGFIEFLIKNKKLINCDSKIMAAQLCLPISAWISLCDREPEKEEETLKLIEQHIKQFFEIYKAN